MTAAWLEGMRRYCERRFEDVVVDVSVRDLGAFHRIRVRMPNGWQHAVAVEANDSPKDVADHLEAAIKAMRLR